MVKARFEFSALLTDFIQQHLSLEHVVAVVEIPRVELNANGRFAGVVETDGVQPLTVFTYVGEVYAEGWFFDDGYNLLHLHELDCGLGINRTEYF